ncbi:aldo/keto reductase [Streptomyces zingiberis]|uniref:aldo/keto reductase n=1 Tax=Streptomyces zingiberis TaxID=2053010 RepID=UPI0035D4384E
MHCTSSAAPPGPPPRAAEKFFGRVLRRDLAPCRDELVLSTEAGNPLGPSPYLKGGSRKSLPASLDHSLRDLGTDDADIFYSHSPDLSTPITKTATGRAGSCGATECAWSLPRGTRRPARAGGGCGTTEAKLPAHGAVRRAELVRGRAGRNGTPCPEDVPV